tara:strand:- start:91 stop:618 length:528 start_codon:yes stop_codon:yes gene_type:complete
MFWFKKSTLKRDIKVLIKIIDTLEKLSINDKFTRANALAEGKNILNDLYPNKYKDWNNSDWKDNFYGLTPDGQKDLIDEAKDILKDLKGMTEEELKILPDDHINKDIYIKDIETKINFYKSDYRIQFLSEIRINMSYAQKDVDKKKFDTKSFELIDIYKTSLYKKLDIQTDFYKY